jgi:hypothetical protein
MKNNVPGKDIENSLNLPAKAYWDKLAASPDFKFTFDHERPIPLFAVFIEDLKKVNTKVYGKKRKLSEFKGYLIGSGSIFTGGISLGILGLALFPVSPMIAFGLIPLGLMGLVAGVPLSFYDKEVTTNYAWKVLRPKYAEAVKEWLLANNLKDLAEHPDFDTLLSSCKGTFKITKDVSYEVTNNNKFIYIEKVVREDIEVPANLEEPTVFFALPSAESVKKKALTADVTALLNEDTTQEEIDTSALAHSILEADEDAEELEAPKV